ncbi:hypothetical protein M4951_17545 [Blastopirellula sp. J2-11]|uniref:hypothetical protein n=1 Tax=Blastopirellula sp. J2-11 TaxID=2943192 RepID=UPI0021C58381|nr:hypothetical protein [Blastopirellula sp. J2-11]UUO05178.1 hypothetical protein M4951_17545 [Blastopirellula sp. J2-11]
MRFFQLFFLMVNVSAIGCGAPPSAPTFPAIERVTAQVHSSREMSVPEIEKVEVPPEDTMEVLRMVLPVTFKKDGIRPHLNFHIADVYLHHKDSSVTKIEVRCTGHNPAAVTVDGSNYFYASIDGPADGARGLVDLLMMIDFKEKKSEQSGND